MAKFKGLKMICFECGKVGHRAKFCPKMGRSATPDGGLVRTIRVTRDEDTWHLGQSKEEYAVNGMVVEESALVGKKTAIDQFKTYDNPSYVGDSDDESSVAVSAGDCEYLQKQVADERDLRMAIQTQLDEASDRIVVLEDDKSKLMDELKSLKDKFELVFSELQNLKDKVSSKDLQTLIDAQLTHDDEHGSGLDSGETSSSKSKRDATVFMVANRGFQQISDVVPQSMDVPNQKVHTLHSSKVFDTNRFRGSSFHCGRYGHRFFTCKVRVRGARQVRNQARNHNSFGILAHGLDCYECGEGGHVAHACPFRWRSGSFAPQRRGSYGIAAYRFHGDVPWRFDSQDADS